MRKYKSVLCVVLSFIMMFSVGCNGDTGNKPSDKDKPIVGKYSTVYTAPSTNKVMRSASVPDDATGILSLSSSKGEAESAQIIISASGVSIDSYSVVTANLTCGANTFDASNIEVFVQHYVKTTTKTNKTFPTGWYPDALIPYEMAKAKGELQFNPNGENDNQGLWLTFSVPSAQKAGLYTGEIKLTVEGENFAVPVELTVFDFALPKVNHAKTAFAVWEDREMIEAGYRSGGKDITALEKDEIVKKEYEYLISKHISPTNLPSSEYVSGNARSFATAAKKYASRDEVASFRIAVNAPSRILSGEQLTSFLTEILKECITDNVVTIDIFSKLFCYFAEIDEPHPTTGGADIYDKVKGVNDTFMASKQTVLDLIDSSYSNVVGIDKVKASIRELPHIVTSERRGELLGKVQTYCPQVQFYNDKNYYDTTEKRKTENSEGVWWYTCLKPVYPYPSYHIDDTLVGARVMSWMQKDYKVGGTLYWSSNIYRKYSASTGYTDRDIWNDPLAFPGANGDGYLTYPGVKYGVQEPLGTIRLDNIRDAQEDYEYLTLLESLLGEANAKYATSVTLDSLLRDIYDTLYNGTIAINDYKLVLEARREVATLIEALSQDKSAIIDIKPYSASSDAFEVNVITDSSSAVKIDGVEASKSGNVFVGSAKKGSIEIEINGKKYVRNMGGKFTSLDGLDENNPFEGSDYTLSVSDKKMDGTGSIKAVLNPNTAEGELYEAKLDYKFGEKDFSDVKRLTMYVYNDSDIVVKPTLKIIDSKNVSSRNEKIGHLYPKQWNKIEIDVNQTKTMDLTKVTKLQLSLKNINSGNITLYLDNITYNS